MSANLLTGRQHLLLIYKEFARSEEDGDEIAYSNLETLEFSGQDSSLESFLSLWDQLMMSFKSQPSQTHLFSALLKRLRKCNGLRLTIEHIDRQLPGHPDRSYEFLIAAARRFVERRRAERQTQEYAKLFKGGTQQDVALPVIPPATSKGKGKGDKGNGAVRICFKMRDTNSCPEGSSCPYSHDRAQIEKARREKKEKDEKRGTLKETMKFSKPCKYFATPRGCKKGNQCTFLHRKKDSAMIAGAVTTKDAEPKPTGKGSQT